MKKWIVILLVSAFLVSFGSIEKTDAATMQDYCQLPPFVSNVVAPNVFFVIDASGSMAWPAYNCTTDPCGFNSPAYSASTTYGGYFDTDKSYACTPDAGNCNRNDNVYRETSGAPCTRVCDTFSCLSSNSGGDVRDTTVCPSNRPWKHCLTSHQTGDCNPQSGNYLNYLHMHRVDLVRWAVTGGSPATCNGSFNASLCDPELVISGTTGCNSSIAVNDTGSVTGGCVLEADDGTLIAVPMDNIYQGLAYNFGNLTLQPRLGAMFFSGSGVRSTGKIYLGDYPGTASRDATYPYKNLIAAINSQAPNDGTPTGPAMWDALHYFSQVSATHGGMSIQTGTSTQYRNPMYICDTNGANCSFVPCTKNFVMLLSDGQWNTPGCTIGNSPYTDSSDPVVPAYQMHKGFTNAVSSAASQVSSVYTLGLFLGGTGSQALKNVSMYGSFDTAHGAWPASLTGYPLTTCSMTDCGTGKGSSCTALPATSGDWDKDANSVPDTFYSSSDALGIKDAIYNAILDTLRRVSSGTAVSILTSTQGSGANLLQAVFYPKKVFGTAGSAKEISWISDVQDLWFFYDPLLANLSIREDTDQNKILNLSNDKILEFFYDTTTQAARAHLWSDAGDGTKLNPGSPATVDFDDVNAIWKAGRLLWQRSASDRTIYTSLNGSSFSTFSSANSTSLRPYLQASTNTEAGYVIDYVRGVDRNAAGSPPNYRDRTVSINGAGPYVWKLGDVISSTPAVSATSALNAYHKAAPGGYGDATYEKFVGTSDYLNRGMVFLGANDGMFHAFTMGKLQEKWSGQGAREKGMISLPTGLPTGYSVGDERWAYIPKHALPYLIYLTDDAYSHLFYVDLNPVAADVSITTPTYASSSSTVDCYPATAPTCTSGNYYDCPKQTCTDKSTNAIVSSSWETIVIGGMGTGGASRSTTDACSAANDCVKAPLADPADNTKALGLSSYFAMKVTNQNSPALLWEFSSPDLGYATTGAAIVRVSGKINGTGSLNSATNGRWFAVLASGPTGPITSNQFKGNSINNLKIFILDLKTGSLLRTIDTGKTNAFAGSLFNAATDLDRNDPPRAGNYSDDVLYFGYTQKDTVAGTWTKGGVMRLVTHESTDPATWTFSDVITDTGPVTRAVVKLQDINAGKLWLYFGSGRYYYKIGTTIDDSDTQRALYGVTEPCYVASTNSYDPACTSLRYVGDLTNQTTTISSTASASGWKINLEQSSTSYKAERVVTDPVAASTGAVFFTTYEPSSDVCSLEGNTFLWGVKYDNGGILPASALSGELIIQVSTGAIEQKQLSSSFASGRRSAAITGKPSPSAPSLANNAGLKSTPKYMNLKER